MGKFFKSRKERQTERSFQIGTSKAKRDIELVQVFMQEHDHNPPSNIADPFLESLGRDVNREDQAEAAAYRLHIEAFQRSYVRQRRSGISAQVFEVPIGEDGMPDIQGIAEQFGEETAQALIGALSDILGRRREENLEAGKCLGCGGGITAEGDCDREVSETETGLDVASMSPSDKLNHITSLRAQLDQIKASVGEVGDLTPSEQVKLDRISAELQLLAESEGDQ